MRAAEALARGMKRLRRRLGLTQAAVAEAAEVHTQYISQVERQQRSPSLEVIDAIAAALDVTAPELFAEGARGSSESKASTSERVERLLRAWTGRDQEKLVRLLVDLRAMAGRR